MALDESTLLCRNPKTTVKDYRSWESSRDREKIAQFLAARLRERYIDPVKYTSSKNGFATMALCCLLIDTLQAFYDGPKKRPVIDAFERFFDTQDRFSVLRGHSKEFYRRVRCGILHQGETGRGWKITRAAGRPLFEPSTLTINAAKFLMEMDGSLTDLQTRLRSMDWNDPLWENVRARMTLVIANCAV